MNFKKVMLIDDNEIDNYIVKIVMEKIGFAREFLVHYKAGNALNYLKKNKENIQALPEIIFLDINMPLMTGWQFLNEFKRLPDTVIKQCPVILITSSIDPSDFERAEKFDCVFGIIKKPLRGEMLTGITKESILQNKRYTAPEITPPIGFS